MSSRPARELVDPFGRRRLGESVSAERPIFVFATGERCGSTLLLRLLNSHPDVHLWGEQRGALEHLGAFHALAAAHAREYPETAEAYLQTLDRGFIANLAPGPAALRNALARLLLALYGGYAPRWGCKEIRCGAPVAAMIVELFPQARFVFLSRHVLPVLRSLHAWGYSVEECRVVLERWCRLARELVALPAAVRARSRVLRYEELVGWGQAELRDLARFLALAPEGFDPAVLELRVADHRTIEPVGPARTRALCAPEEIEALADCAEIRALLHALGHASEGRRP